MAHCNHEHDHHDHEEHEENNHQEHFLRDHQVKADMIPIHLDQLKLRRPNYPDNCLILDIADNVKERVEIVQCMGLFVLLRFDEMKKLSFV